MRCTVKNIRIIAIFVILALTLCAFAGCSGADETSVRVSVLNGTTGFGMAKLMNDKPDGYTFTVETDASNITAALIAGNVDIAALPTNAAANLYNKSGGKIKVIAVNTLGVLYVVTNGAEIASLADLDGKTVFCPAQNPAFIFDALCKKCGIDVTIDTAYAQPADLRTAVAAGKVPVAVLPEPMVTIACSANLDVISALDITAEWNKVFPENSLIQGCVAVRTEFAEEHPEAVEKFLSEYKKSVEFVRENPADASQMIVDAGIFAQAKVAERAIPRCNLCYIDGAEMKAAFSAYLERLYSVDPAYVGGKLPDGGFYYEK